MWASHTIKFVSEWTQWASSPYAEDRVNPPVGPAGGGREGNQAYSRLSTTHGHITDCKFDSVVYAWWFSVDLSCLGQTIYGPAWALYVSMSNSKAKLPWWYISLVTWSTSVLACLQVSNFDQYIDTYKIARLSQKKYVCSIRGWNYDYLFCTRHHCGVPHGESCFVILWSKAIVIRVLSNNNK